MSKKTQIKKVIVNFIPDEKRFEKAAQLYAEFVIENYRKKSKSKSKEETV